MKKLISILFFVISVNNLFSQTNPTYTLMAKNFNRNAPDSIMFDIYILHTNPSATNFEYALGQYFFKFNPSISNGGSLTYRIIDSELPAAARPRNPTVSNDELRLATNVVLGAGNGPSISSTVPGTLVVRMSLRTSASSFASNQSLNLVWKNSNQPVPFTKVFAYVGTANTEITTPSTHTVEDPMSIHQLSSEIPDSYNLSQNYPNPFNPSTKINFSIPKSGFVSLKVYDISGKEIADLISDNLSAGVYQYEFNGSNLSSGVYFYILRSNEFKETKRLMLLK